ncbi:hypothetical protein AOLI_G00211460 [Acnodon oligacanthus]
MPCLRSLRCESESSLESRCEPMRFECKMSLESLRKKAHHSPITPSRENHVLAHFELAAERRITAAPLPAGAGHELQEDQPKPSSCS